MKLQQKQRYCEIDYLKGLAILLMILSHCIPGEDIVKVWISSFNMPIFFVLCGYLRARNDTNGIKNTYQLKEYLCKRFWQILIPYFTFGMGLIAFYQVLSMIGNGKFSIKESLFRLVTLQGIESMWFLSCYFLVELFFLALFLRLPQIFQHAMGAVGILVLSYNNIMGMPNGWLARLMMKCLIGLIFVWLGYYMNKFKMLEKCSLPIGYITMFLCFIGAQINGFCGIGALQFKSIVLFILIGLIESATILFLFKELPNNKNICLRILEKYGKYSIIVVCTNNFWIEVIRLLDYKMCGNVLLNSKWIGSGILFISVSVLELFTIKFFSEKYPQLFGMKGIRK